MDNRLQADGKTQQIDVASTGFVEKYPMDFGKADRLSVFGSYQFFTPALLYLYGGFTDQVWLQMQQELNRDITLMFHKFDRSIFQGLEAPNGDKDWNHALWAVTKDEWAAVETYLLSMVFMHAGGRSLHKIGSQDVAIMDPLYLDTKKVISADTPTIEVVNFGVNGSGHCIALTGHPPRIMICEPQEKIVKFAKTLLGGFDKAQHAADDMEHSNED